MAVLLRKWEASYLRSPEQSYDRRAGFFNQLIQQQEKAERMLNHLRLATFLIGIGAAIFVYSGMQSYIFAASVFAVFAAIFIYLVVRHERLKDQKKFATSLRDINISSLKRLRGQWNTFSDDGKDFRDDNHSYSSDLDIFGKSSLFQWINTAVTFTGRHKLKDLLSGEIESSTDILERQEAVEELATLMTWRQRFLADGLMASGKMRDPRELIAWAREANEVFRKPWVILVFRAFPAITSILIVTAFVLNIVPTYLPVVALVIQFGMISFRVEARGRMFSIAESYSDDLRIYYKMLKHIEQQSFSSPYINMIKDSIRNVKGLEVFGQLDRLSKVIDSISQRRNLFSIIFNTLVLWDFQNIIALEHWKQKAGDVEAWFEALGQIEALASLAVIRFDNPGWVVPTISEEGSAVLQAKDLGHPLLTGGRSHNDLTVDEKTRVLLITGSNMSGKSTLLRTAGVNLVLAYAGAPVCASSFRASVMSVYSSMRVGDNLGENISSFYAELLRIKTIVGQATSGERVFFLLDEIFKGTNSLDRHTGARVLINKLSRTNSIGLVSTHDLELCDIEEENDLVANYHFQEYYKDGKIHFDYILRPGPSTTRNALYLMQLAGIDVAER